MIFALESTKDDKKSVFLFCTRDHLQYTSEQKNSVHTNNDNVNNLNEQHKDGEEKNTTHEEKITQDENVTHDEHIAHDKNIIHNQNTTGDENITHDENRAHKENSTYDENSVYVENLFIDLDESIEPHVWDDYDCFKISQENFFPSNVMNLNIQKIVITRFLNFYVGGKLPKGLSVADVLFAVISIIPLTADNEEFIWHNNEYRENGTLFFLTPEEKLSYEFKNIGLKKKKTNDNQFTDKQNKKLKSTISAKIDSSKENVNSSTEYDSALASTSDTVNKPDCEKNNENVDAANKSKTLPDKQDDKDKSINIADLLCTDTIKWCGKLSSDVIKTVDKQPDFGPAQNSAFNTSCNKILDTWDVSAKSRTILKYFFGIVALTLMKAIVKRKNNLMNKFSGESFRNRIVFIDSIINYTRPNESCVIKCCREFKIRERCHQVMFAKVLFNSFRVDYMFSHNMMCPSYGLYNIFRMCVVEHLAYYDMGIINLLKSIYKCIRDYSLFSIIIEDLQSEEIEACMEQVRYFIKHYMIKTENKTLTHHWVRFFDDEQFEYLSCANSYATAVVLGVFIENMTGNGDLWRSGWVKTQEDDLARYKELGDTLYKEYKLKSKAKEVKLFLQFTSLLDSMKL